MAKIFLIEDNDNLREAVSSYLTLDGHTVVEYTRLRGLHEQVKTQSPDLLILDVMLPDGDGFITAKALREDTQIPIIFMTARSSESDRITGFEIGGDDYIVKPFSPKELVLRVKAILKRSQTPRRDHTSRWELDSHTLVIDVQSHTVIHDNTQIDLTAAEWKILHYLSKSTGTLIERSKLLTESLDYMAEGSERTIDTHVKNIRAKLSYSGWIQTVRGFGYRFSGISK